MLSKEKRKRIRKSSGSSTVKANLGLSKILS